MAESQVSGTSGRLFGGIVSVSRALQAVALVMLLMIGIATVHQLITLRTSIVDDTARQMARLDMVFAEQTGRAVETVDFVLRNAIETLQSLSVDKPPPAAEFDALLARRTDGVRQMSDLAITNASGDVVYSAHPAGKALPPEGKAALAFYLANPQTGLRFTPPFRDAGGKWTALITRGITGADGKMTGMAVAWLNLAYFEDFYQRGGPERERLHHPAPARRHGAGALPARRCCDRHQLRRHAAFQGRARRTTSPARC